MPPRRSVRASVQTVTKTRTVKVVSEKTAKPPVKPTRKRAASPEPPTQPRAPKRSRIVNEEPESKPTRRRIPASGAGSANKTTQPPAKKPRTKLERLPEKKELKEKPPQSKPYFNPLPTIPQKERPGLILFAWGAGNFGQFGMGPDVLDELSKPRRNHWVEEQMVKGTFGEEGAGLEAIAAGGMHSLFIDEKGTVWSCGVNDNAALGRFTANVPDPNNPGSFLDVDELTSVPWPVESLVDENFRAVRIAAGDNIGAAISDQGEFRVWGTFRCAEGALGFSSDKAKQHLPVDILKLSHRPGDYEKVTSIAAGNNHLLIVTTHGHLYTLGDGEQGQLGRRIIGRRKIHGTQPEKINIGSRARKVVNVGAGSYHSLAIDDEGDVWGWGLNTMGQTGTGWESQDDDIVLLPQRVDALSKENLGGDGVVQVTGGEHHSLFLTASGKVYACGRLDGGQLGLEDDNSDLQEWKKEYAERFDGQEPQFFPSPTLITFPDEEDRVVQISCGVHNNAAVTEGGALYSWGQGPQGELGCPDVEIRTPKVIVRKDGGSWFTAAVSCGGQHSLGLLRKKL